MGLDMYLSAERYYWFNEPKPEAPNGFPVQSLRVEAGYWRKANQIHAWFVDNVQDGEDECREYYVSREQLIELRDTCKQVLADPKKAEELLPPRSGFFFGSTDVDEGYIEDLEITVDILDRCLDETLYPPSEWDFFYWSNW